MLPSYFFLPFNFYLLHKIVELWILPSNFSINIYISCCLKVLPSTDQIKELQTIIRDKCTSRSDFKFVADRLIRMVIEEGLNQLPYTRDGNNGKTFFFFLNLLDFYLKELEKSLKSKCLTRTYEKTSPTT